MFIRSALIISLLVAFGSRALGATDVGPDYARDVKPIFEKHCYGCHGPTKQTSGYRLDVRDLALKGGDSGEAAIIPHNSEAGSLLEYVANSDAELRMPPSNSGVAPLDDNEINTLRSWIKAGPAWPDNLAGSADDGRMKHWAWRKVIRPSIPNGEEANPVDCFLKAADPTHSFASEADPRTLIRRLTYDLTGLPPSPEEVAKFEQDHSPAAYDALVNRLLDSPRYGERWGRKWLDVVRYADTAGDTADFPVPDAWRYRNWVIDSFNRNLPYNEFLKQQIAGDILADSASDKSKAEMITATGYWAIARRFGADGDKDMYLTYDDAIDNFGKSMLGLSIACARCHDHKYDPITTLDYYSIYGILSSTRFAFAGTELRPTPRDLVPITMPNEQKILQAWADEKDRLEADYSQKSSACEEYAKQVSQSAPVLSELVSGEIDANGAAEFSLPISHSNRSTTTLRAGEMIQLSINMRGNHGGDSTAIELTIEEVNGNSHIWNTAKDIVPNLFENGEGAMHSDSFGNKGVWLFYDIETGASLLDKHESELAGVKGVSAWRRGDDLPLVFANTNDSIAKFLTIVAPPKALSLHPGPRGGVAIAWRAPVDGEFKVTGKVAKIDSGGDGITWRVDKRADLLSLLTSGKKLVAERDSAQAARDAHLANPMKESLAYAVVESPTITDTHVHLRGDPEKLGVLAPRKNLEIFGGEKVTKGSGRQELAEWVCRPDHPLTARVMVNRIWQGHFGRGIVATPNDFGVRGQPPTHPELLDWLASEFVERGWSVKSMHRLMVTSRAYRQSSDSLDTPWPMERRRLEAEELRDSLLCAGGQLDLEPALMHALNLQPGYRFTQHVPFNQFLDTRKRSVYLLTLRLKRHPLLGLFDGADPNSTTPGRAISTVPTQALFFLNDPFFHECSDAFGKRISRLTNDDTDRIQAAFQIALQRKATEEDIAMAKKFLANAREQFADLPEAERNAKAWATLSRVWLASNEFLHLD